jgi:hypothetical protein
MKNTMALLVLLEALMPLLLVSLTLMRSQSSVDGNEIHSASV